MDYQDFWESDKGGIMMYAIKYKRDFVKFQSYGQMLLVDYPENATLYTTLKDAQRRFNKTKNEILSKDLKIVKINFTYTEKSI